VLPTLYVLFERGSKRGGKRDGAPAA